MAERTGERTHGNPHRRRAAPVHFQRWAPQDWLSSPLRGELALERDHLTRAVYRDLLDVLHERGGYLPRSEVKGACLVTHEEAEHAIARLLASGRVAETDDGRLYNERVLADLAGEREWRDEQARSGSAGGRARADRMTPEERSESARRAALAKRERGAPSQQRGDPTHAPRTSVGSAKRLRSLPSPSPPPLPLQQSESEADADERMAAGERKEANEPETSGAPRGIRGLGQVAGEIVRDVGALSAPEVAGDDPVAVRVARIQHELGDREPPTFALRRIAERLPPREIEAALIDVRTRRADGQGIRRPVAYFTRCMSEKAAELGIALDLAPRSRPVRANAREAMR